jgi:hypothetical protein
VLLDLGADRRRDALERAELSCGSYEVVATKEYFVRLAMPVIHVFVIDVGHAAVASGATAATCQCIEQVLDSLQGEQVSRPCSSCMHAFHKKKGLERGGNWTVHWRAQA